MHSKANIFVAILAAGQSRRFGNTDKLVEPLNGKPLGLHICDALLPLDCAQSFVITSAANHACVNGWQERGFKTVVNEKAEEGLGTSVALAAKLARAASADALLICLADMPLVPTSHLERLVDAFNQSNENIAIASYDGQTASPPAIFGKQHYPALASLNGEGGARELLTAAQKIPIRPDLLMDVDTGSQLEQAKASFLRPIVV